TLFRSAVATTKAVTDGVEESRRADLRTHLGWFADLARGPGLADSPRDAEIRQRSVVVLAAVGLIFTAGVFGIFVGGALLFLYLRRIRQGRSANAFFPGEKPNGVLLECFALYLGIMTAGALLGAYVNGYLSPVSYILAVVVPLCW